MNTIKSSVVAALAAFLVIPMSLSAEPMRVEKKLTVPPDLQFFFGASTTGVRDAIHRFVGEKAEAITVKPATAKPDESDRPRRFVKTVEAIPCEDWRNTSWWVECRFERDDASNGTNVCDYCRRHLDCGTFVQPFWTFKDNIPFDWHWAVIWNDEAPPKTRCGTIAKAVPIRFAKVKVWAEVEKYTDTRDNSIAAQIPRYRFQVLDVVSTEDFYDKGHYEAEKIRKAKYEEWGRGEAEKGGE